MSLRSKHVPYSLVLTTLLGTFASSGLTAQVLTPLDWGIYDQDGYGHCTLSYLAGDNASSGVTEFRNFFIFDLTAVVDPIHFAVLRIYNPGLAQDGYDGYISPDPTETYTLFDVSTDLEALCEGGDGLTGYFDDLGTGLYYGSRVVSAADNGNYVEVTLVTNALVDMEAADGEFAIGGAITSLSGDPLQVVFAYSFSNPSIELVLETEIFADGFESGDKSRWLEP